MQGFNCDDFDPEQVGGFDRVLPSAVHAQVVGVDPDAKGGSLAVDFEILRATVAGQEGKVHQEKFADDMKKVFQKKRAALAFATGIVTMEMMKAAKVSKEPITPDWQAMLGKQVCMNLTESESKGTMYTNLNWDEIWHPLDKKAYHVPLHAGMLARAGIKLPADRPIDGVKPTSSETLKQEAIRARKAEGAAAADVDSLMDGVV